MPRSTTAGSPAAQSPGARRAPAASPARAAVLAAALDLLTQRGYEATTVEAIRKASGVSIGSIYHHFGGKEGIAAALYLDALRDYQAGFLAALQGRHGARTGIEAAVRFDVDWIAANPDAARLLLADREARAAAAATDDLRATNRAFFSAVQAWMAPRAARGEIRRLDPDLFEALVLGPSHAYARHHLAGRATTPLATARRALAAAAWAAVAPET